MQKEQLVEEEVNNNYVSYKIYLVNSDEKRRLGFKKTPSFEKFSEQLRSLFFSSPEQAVEEGRNMKIKYVDEEKDFITVSSAQEWREASIVLESFPIKRIYVSFENDAQKPLANQLPLVPFVPRGINPPCRGINKPSFGKRGLNIESRQCPSPSTPLPEEVEQIPPSSIEALKEGSLVHLRSKVSGKNLRVLANGAIDFLGGKGKRATFVVHLGRQCPNAIRLQNLNDPKRWLRINKKGEPDASGKGGIFTEFVLLPPKAQCNNNNNNKCNKMKKNKSVPYEACEETASLPLVCLRSLTTGLQIGANPDGTFKDPKKVGRGNRAQFFIVQKI